MGCFASVPTLEDSRIPDLHHKKTLDVRQTVTVGNINEGTLRGTVNGEFHRLLGINVTNVGTSLMFSSPSTDALQWTMSFHFSNPKSPVNDDNNEEVAIEWLVKAKIISETNVVIPDVPLTAKATAMSTMCDSDKVIRWMVEDFSVDLKDAAGKTLIALSECSLSWKEAAK